MQERSVSSVISGLAKTANELALSQYKCANPANVGDSAIKIETPKLR